MDIFNTRGKNQVQKVNPATLIVLFTFIIVSIFAGNSHAALKAAAGSSNSITISWTATGDNGTTGTASFYDIRYHTSLIDAANWDQAAQVINEPDPLPTGSNESYTVTGLLPSTTYYFAIKIGDEIPNWSPMSNVVFAATSVETVSPAAIANLNSATQTQNSITIDWTAPGDDGNVGTASQYDIRYSTTPIDDANWDQATRIADSLVPLVAGSTQSLTVDNLSENTSYYFAIKSADEVPNWSTMSNLLNVSTTPDQTPPAAIDDLQAFEGTNNGEMILTWTAPGDDDLFGQASAYLIRYSTRNINPKEWSAPVTETSNFVANPPTPGESGSVDSLVISGLMPGELYYVGIKALDESDNVSGISNTSSAISFFDLSLDIEDELAALPESYRLSQNYPNPFNPTTEISFNLPEQSEVNLYVYNSLGQEVAKLVDDNLSAGSYTVDWNGQSDNGAAVSSGIYFYRIEANQYSEVKKMVLMK